MNAVILAAGLSSRFAPLSYEKPKGLLVVKGEVLIERQIRQLLEAGVSNITIVVGYKAEMFDYLTAKYGVELILNEDYNKYNNISSVIRVLDRLDNTYICSSDNYFSRNVFIGNPSDSFYSSLYAHGRTNEYCLSIDENDYIKGVSIGGADAWYMVGHVFFNREFSNNFKKILLAEYCNEQVRKGYWEDLYIKYIDQLPMKVNRYMPGEIEEFDSIDDLRKFDDTYEDLYKRLNQDEALKTLLTLQHRFHIFPEGELSKAEVRRIGGMSNKNFKVSYQGKNYVLRIPGIGADGMVDRSNEEYNSVLSSDMEISPALFYFDSQTGVKVTEYLENAEIMTPNTIQDRKNLDKIIKIYQRLHMSKEPMANKFDIFEEIVKYDLLLEKAGGEMYDGWEIIRSEIMALKQRLDVIGYEQSPCHNDAVAENFITNSDGTMYLIDWEYSGMNDPMADIAALFLENDFSNENKEYVLSMYFANSVPWGAIEKITIFQILWDYLWAQWTVIKEAKGDDFGTYGRDRYERAIRNMKEYKHLSI